MGQASSLCEDAVVEEEELDVLEKEEEEGSLDDFDIDRAALCANGCGLNKFSRFPTCCTHCKGPAGPHARDCLVKSAAAAEEMKKGLSYIAEDVLEVLMVKHCNYRGVCWNVTHGTVVGELLQTPPASYFGEAQITPDIEETHSDYFPEKMFEIICKAEAFVDFASLGAPDGKFLAAIARGLKELANTGREITVRVLTGNIIGMPTDNRQVCAALVKSPGFELPEETKVKLWVGSWRKGLSWNHAKFIAVDGTYLFQGGHNMWDPHYLKKNPVRDVSMECEGQVVQEAHAFANNMWQFIIRKSTQYATQKVPRLSKSNVDFVHWPGELDTAPPMYDLERTRTSLKEGIAAGQLPMLPIGRLGNLHGCDDSANPADSAIVAMLKAAKKCIKCSLQDLGPPAVPLPGGACALPGCPWPDAYMRELGRAIYDRGVDVELVLSNPGSIPANLSMTEAQYGNGWTCNDVAAEILKTIKQYTPDVDEERLTGLMGVNLRIAYMRTSRGPSDWKEARRAGNHAKFFIVDDICYYVGSQNLYIANLAEWGIVVDSEKQTKRVLDQYWNKLWTASWENVPKDERDFNLDAVMAGLSITRKPLDMDHLSPEELEKVLLARKVNKLGGSRNSLTVWVKKARNLRNADGPFGGGSDAFVRLSVYDQRTGQKIGPARETKIIWDIDKDAEWNEVFEFEGLDLPEACTLKMKVLDKDSFLGLSGWLADVMVPDDELGRTTIDLSELQRSKKFQHFELVVEKGWVSDAKLQVALHNRGVWGK